MFSHLLIINISSLLQIDPDSKQPTGVEFTVKDTPLLINIKGCGYPPDVNCDIYAEKYSNFSLVSATLYLQPTSILPLYRMAKHFPVTIPS